MIPEIGHFALILALAGLAWRLFAIGYKIKA